MSTCFYLKQPIPRQELESVGVNFQEGELRENPYTWIVESKDTNYLHPHIDDDGTVYGWTRYGGNSSGYLIDILDQNLIEWCSEYDLQDSEYPIQFVQKLTGHPYEVCEDFLIENLPSVDYYWSDNKRQFVLDFLEEEKQTLQEYLEEYLAEQE